MKIWNTNTHTRTYTYRYTQTKNRKSILRCYLHHPRIVVFPTPAHTYLLSNDALSLCLNEKYSIQQIFLFFHFFFDPNIIPFFYIFFHFTEFQISKRERVRMFEGIERIYFILLLYFFEGGLWLYNTVLHRTKSIYTLPTLVYIRFLNRLWDVECGGGWIKKKWK